LPKGLYLLKGGNRLMDEFYFFFLSTKLLTMFLRAFQQIYCWFLRILLV